MCGGGIESGRAGGWVISQLLSSRVEQCTRTRSRALLVALVQSLSIRAVRLYLWSLVVTLIRRITDRFGSTHCWPHSKQRCRFATTPSVWNNSNHHTNVECIYTTTTTTTTTKSQQNIYIAWTMNGQVLLDAIRPNVRFRKRALIPHNSLRGAR